MKEIIITVDEEGNIELETVGFVGRSCVDESKFIKDLLGKENESLRHYKPVFYGKEKNNKKVYKNICG